MTADSAAPTSWRLKMDQAIDHLALLKVAFDQYKVEANLRILRETVEEPEPHEEFVFHSEFPPPPEWGPLIGDCVHNLRSGLDHLFYALPRDPKSKPDDENISFPCWYGWKPTHRSLKGLSQPVLEAIQRLQSFDPSDPAGLMSGLWVGPPIPTREGHLVRNQTRHPLDALNRLSNADKHRQLLVGTAISWNLAWQGQDPTHYSPGPLMDGETVMIFAPSDEVPTVHHVDFDLAFEQGWPGYGQRTIQTLGGIVQFIGGRVLAELEHFTVDRSAEPFGPRRDG